MSTPGKGTKNDVTRHPQWDGFLAILNASDLEVYLSHWYRNSKLCWTLWELKKQENSRRNENDQTTTMKVIKVNNECKTLLFIANFELSSIMANNEILLTTI